VRRKINQLVKLGWVRKHEDGSFHATSKAKKDLEPLTLASIRYIAVMMQLFAETFESQTRGKASGTSRKRPTKAI
jgi:hypothetical protein